MIWEWEESYGVKLSMSYNMSGGEPFLRGDIFEILEELAWKGADIYILSNGTLIDKGIARRIADHRVNGIQVSIEGPEGIHDEIRGEGSFAGAIRGVKNLLEAGMTVTLNSTLSTVNAKYFLELIDLAKSVGASGSAFRALSLMAGGLP